VVASVQKTLTTQALPSGSGCDSRVVRGVVTFCSPCHPLLMEMHPSGQG